MSARIVYRSSPTDRAGRRAVQCEAATDGKVVTNWIVMQDTHASSSCTDGPHQRHKAVTSHVVAKLTHSCGFVGMVAVAAQLALSVASCDAKSRGHRRDGTERCSYRRPSGLSLAADISRSQHANQVSMALHARTIPSCIVGNAVMML